MGSIVAGRGLEATENPPRQFSHNQRAADKIIILSDSTNRNKMYSRERGTIHKTIVKFESRVSRQ